MKTTSTKFLLSAFALFAIAWAGVGCNEDEPAPEKRRLTKPVLTERDVTVDAFTVAWNGVEHADRYAYTLDDGEETETRETTLRFDGCESGREYTVRVKAVPEANSARYEESAWAVLKVITLGVAKLPTPAPEQFDAGVDFVAIEWADADASASEAVDHYVYTFDGGEETVTRETSAIFEGLQLGSSHTFRIKAVPAADSEIYLESDWGECGAETLSEVPAREPDIEVVLGEPVYFMKQSAGPATMFLIYYDGYMAALSLIPKDAADLSGTYAVAETGEPGTLLAGGTEKIGSFYDTTGSWISPCIGTEVNADEGFALKEGSLILTAAGENTYTASFELKGYNLMQAADKANPVLDDLTYAGFKWDGTIQLPPVCPTPAIEQTGSTADSVTVEWICDESNYFEVMVYDSNEDIVYMSETGSHKTTIPGLESGRTYIVKVRAYPDDPAMDISAWGECEVHTAAE